MAAARIYQGKWVLVKLPLALLALAAMAWLWMAYFPLPPSQLNIGTGLPEGVYHEYGRRYSEIFAQHGVALGVASSDGSQTNLQRLRGKAEPRVDLAFVQGGMGFEPGERHKGDRIETIARVGSEPLWIFARSPLDSLEQLRGLRVSLGPRGSGTRKLALALLQQERMSAADIVDSEISGPPAAQALQQGTLDVLVMVSAPQSPVVRELLGAPGVALVQLKRSSALTERLPYLQLRLLPRGAIDARLPQRDVALLVTTTSLVARADLHPALQRLAAEVARQVHSAPGPFQRAGDFPSLRRIEFPASAEARRTLTSGRPWLEEHLPFWTAQVAMRALVICLPIALIAWWLAHTIPAYLRWLLESRIARWYGELKFIEHDLAKESMTGMDRLKSRQRIESIENAMRDFPTPPDLMPRWFTLREHVEFVRARLARARGR
ncbi:MAG TPA: TAXI family TRAP transporter solute-binding subunit [Ramlibacter sp.]|nr:TAXI family TRAP transporter solute-binding subunit [Ramlibacter sp.]